jgi:hypothetical protein
VKSKLYYGRRLVRQSVSVSGTHLRPSANFSPSFFILRQLWVCLYGMPSLTRVRVRSFQLLLDIASSDFLGPQSHGTHEHILLTLFFRPSKPGGPGSCIYFPQEQLSYIPGQLRFFMWDTLFDEKSASVVCSFCSETLEQPCTGLSPTEFMSIFYCVYFLDYPNLDDRVPVFISPKNRVAQLFPRYWVCLINLLLLNDISIVHLCMIQYIY